MKAMWIGLFGGILFGLATGCGSSGTSCDQPTAIAGTWKGSVQDQEFGSGTLELDLTQSTCSIVGSGTLCFGNQCNNGSFNGRVNGSAFSGRLSTSSLCPLDLSATVFESSAMAGSYQSPSCPQPESATFKISRQ